MEADTDVPDEALGGSWKTLVSSLGVDTRGLLRARASPLGFSEVHVLSMFRST